jgi:CheY-like chemotaxis protein
VGKGTGLGLSMVYGFVKQSGGHIAIKSEEGRGTTVWIYLPQIEGTAITATDSRISESPRGGHGTILIVEDDALVRTYVITQIRSLGYTTLSAANAREALTVLRSSDPIDLLFTDVIMPGSMNGRELSIEALKLRPTLNVLFTSGFTENAMDQDDRLNPDILLLAKPYSRADLARMIHLAMRADRSDDARRAAAGS